jgi:hypothetical protein
MAEADIIIEINEDAPDDEVVGDIYLELTQMLSDQIEIRQKFGVIPSIQRLKFSIPRGSELENFEIDAQGKLRFADGFNNLDYLEQQSYLGEIAVDNKDSGKRLFLSVLVDVFPKDSLRYELWAEREIRGLKHQIEQLKSENKLLSRDHDSAHVALDAANSTNGKLQLALLLVGLLGLMALLI